MLNYQKFHYNEISSDTMGLYRVYTSDAPTHPLSATKNYTTQKSIYGSHNILTKITPEPLTIQLTLINSDNSPFTPQRIAEIYSYFDVNNYKKLSFDDNPGFYYRVLPFTSASDINLYAQNKGYFTINFICDSHHGYRDWTHTYTPDIIGSVQERTMINDTNVINSNGDYKVYPYIKIKLLEGNSGYFRMGSKQSQMSFELINLTEGEEIEIDGINRQIYSSVTGTKNLNDCKFYETSLKESASADWTVTNKIEFPYLVKGENELYFWAHISQPYKVTITANIPRIE